MSDGPAVKTESEISQTVRDVGEKQCAIKFTPSCRLLRQDVEQLLVYCWHSFAYSGPTLNQHPTRVFRLNNE